MEQFVKGDLLEGANAYHCEKCDKKVIIASDFTLKKIEFVLCLVRHKKYIIYKDQYPLCI